VILSQREVTARMRRNQLVAPSRTNAYTGGIELCWLHSLIRLLMPVGMRS